MSETPPRTATLAITRQIVASAALNMRAKTEALDCEGGFGDLSMPFDPSMTQHHGYLDGALIGYLADTAISWSPGSVVGDVVTSEYRVHILAPGIEESFIGKGQMVKAGRRQVVSSADVFAVSGGEEKLFAIATGTCIPVGQDRKETSA